MSNNFLDPSSLPKTEAEIEKFFWPNGRHQPFKPPLRTLQPAPPSEDMNTYPELKCPHPLWPLIETGSAHLKIPPQLLPQSDPERYNSAIKFGFIPPQLNEMLTYAPDCSFVLRRLLPDERATLQHENERGHIWVAILNEGNKTKLYATGPTPEGAMARLQASVLALVCGQQEPF